MKAMRILFCLLACLFTAAAVPVGIFFGFWWALIAVAAAAACAVGMIFAKKRSEPAPEQTDFMNTDEENADIRSRKSRGE